MNWQIIGKLKNNQNFEIVHLKGTHLKFAIFYPLRKEPIIIVVSIPRNPKIAFTSKQQPWIKKCTLLSKWPER